MRYTTSLRGNVVVAPATWSVLQTTLQSTWFQCGVNILGSSSIGYIMGQYWIHDCAVLHTLLCSIGYITDAYQMCCIVPPIYLFSFSTKVKCANQQSCLLFAQ